MKQSTLEIRSALPRVMIVSDGGISQSHGTGALVMRHFSSYPQERIVQAHCGRASAWSDVRSLQFQPSAAGGLSKALLRTYNALVWRLGPRDWLYQGPLKFTPAIAGVLDEKPDLVYSVVNSATGFIFLDHLMAALPSDMPLLQYCLDYYTDIRGCESYLHRVLGRASELWALTDEIGCAVDEAVVRFGKKVKIQPGFHMDVPRLWKRSHRCVAETDFTCVVTGNFWMQEMALLVKRVWRRVQEMIPGLGPIKWLCHPEGVNGICRAVGNIGPELQHVGFLSGSELMSYLIRADMAIIPFNPTRVPVNPYERYSLPSRMTELLGAGLPIFCIAGEETPLGRYMRRNSLGGVCNAEDEEALARALASFIVDRDGRSAAGQRGREFAEREFQLGPFQEFLYEKLARLSRVGSGSFIT